MNSLKKIFPKVAALLALAFLLAAGCADTPKDPDTNIMPNTSITSYIIDTAPDSATFYNVTVNWGWSDADGEAVAYRYWVGTGDSTDTYDTYAIVRLDFPNNTTTYTFYVQAKDNSNDWDDTPASRVIDITETRDPSLYRPETAFIEGPADGGLASPGIHVVFGGQDVDGVVLSYQYKLDTDTDWSSIDNDLTTGSVALDITGMSLGSRSLAVRAVDNFGQVDASPAEVSFIVVDYLRPDLEITSGLIANAFFFLPSGGTETDVQTGWEGNAAWYYSTLQYRFAVDDSSTWSEWQDDNSALVTGLELGSHVFYLEAKDLGENSTIVTSDLAIGTFVGDMGLIVVNGIHFSSYEDEAWDFYNNVDPVGTFSADFWDAFSGQDYSNTPGLSPIGTGVMPGNTLANYSSMAMIMNGYQGDGEVFNAMLPLIMSYLNAGGNVYLTVRYAEDFLKGDLRAYAQASFASTGVNITASGLVAAVAGLVDQPGASLSGTSLLNTPTSGDVTVLFTAPDFDDEVGGILTEPEGTGKFVYTAGRPYRFDNTAFKTNYDYIMTNFFGE